MKTTSEHISKQLAEIGFRKEAEKLWAEVIRRRNVPNCVECITFDEFYTLEEEWRYEPKNKPKQIALAYDLGTIFDALPDLIFGMVGKLTLHKNGIYVKDSNIMVEKQKNESLADTAARLLIELHEKGLIKF